VCQEASFATLGSSGFPTPADPRPSARTGVGHEEQPLSDVRRADARSAEIERPDGMARAFQVSANKVEPSESILARNLFSKDWDSARLRSLNEVEPVRPEVPLVIKRSSCACCAERLARTGTGPNRSVIGPSGKAEGAAPDADPGEEMALRVAGELAREDLADVSLIDDA
jgi:hypothetical protein